MEETSGAPKTRRRSVASCAPMLNLDSPIPNLDGCLQFRFGTFQTFHSPTLLLAWKFVSDGIVDAVEADAEMAEHFAPVRFSCCCEIDADLRTNKRNHLAEARSRRI